MSAISNSRVNPSTNTHWQSLNNFVTNAKPSGSYVEMSAQLQEIEQIMKSTVDNYKISYSNLKGHDPKSLCFDHTRYMITKKGLKRAKELNRLFSNTVDWMKRCEPSKNGEKGHKGKSAQSHQVSLSPAPTSMACKTGRDFCAELKELTTTIHSIGIYLASVEGAMLRVNARLQRFDNPQYLLQRMAVTNSILNALKAYGHGIAMNRINKFFGEEEAMSRAQASELKMKGEKLYEELDSLEQAAQPELEPRRSDNDSFAKRDEDPWWCDTSHMSDDR